MLRLASSDGGGAKLGQQVGFEAERDPHDRVVRVRCLEHLQGREVVGCRSAAVSDHQVIGVDGVRLQRLAQVGGDDDRDLGDVQLLTDSDRRDGAGALQEGVGLTALGAPLPHLQLDSCPRAQRHPDRDKGWLDPPQDRTCQQQRKVHAPHPRPLAGRPTGYSARLERRRRLAKDARDADMASQIDHSPRFRPSRVITITRETARRPALDRA
jgi:hypothetical protein